MPGGGQTGNEHNEEVDADQPGCLKRLSDRVAGGISRCLERQGRFVARQPLAVIALCVVVSVIGALLLMFQFRQELDGDQLYTPPNAQSFEDRQYVEDLYGFPIVQDRVMVMPTADRDPNLLISNESAKSYLLDLMDLWESIQICGGNYKGEEVLLWMVCFRPHVLGPCKTESILDAWNNSRSILEADENVLGTINGEIRTAYGLPVNKDFVMGGIKKDENGRINHAEVFLVAVDLQHKLEDINGESVDPKARAWDLELVKIVRKKWNSTLLQGFVSNYRAVDQESNKAIMSDIRILMIGYVLIAIYTHIGLFKNSPVFVKSHLAGISILSVGMAIVTSFGIALLITPFNPVVQTLPFLLLGLGVDDTFVIMGSYFNTDCRDSVEKRIGKTMKHAGSSIFVTSVTDLIAFCAGIYTQLPALRSFCIFAAIGILFDFLFQVTFFLAFLALEARREARARKGVPWFGLSCFSATSLVIPEWETSREDSHVSSKIGTAAEATVTHEIAVGYWDIGERWENADKAKVSVENSDGVCKRKIFGKGEFDPATPNLTTRLVGVWLPRITLTNIGTVIVLIIECVLLGFAIYGCSKVYMDFRYREWFTPEGSWLKEGFQVEDRFYDGNQVSFGVYTKEPTDGRGYHEHHEDLLALGKALRTEPHVAPVPELRTWYEDFLEWLPTSQHNASLTPNGHPPNETSFTRMTFDFLKSPGGLAYYTNVKFSKDGQSIISTRIDGFTKDISNGEYAIQVVDGLRSTAKRAAPVFDPIAYHYTFLFYDGYRVIVVETVRNVALAASVVFLVTLVLLADFLAALCVVLMIGLTDVMLFGFMWYVGLTFNTVTSINIILAVGIAVDYSAHLAHSFLSRQGTKKERAQQALFEIGGEVFSGAFTTWLAIAIMGFATHYIFQTFFKMFFCIVVVGLWHGVVVLPVVLRLIGPRAYSVTMG